jgi:hypothetical protein
MTAVAILIPLGLCAKYALYPKTKFDTNMHIPYAAFAKDLKRAGFETGTIIADGYPYALGGNLKRFFPQARVISTKHAKVVPPSAKDGTGKCLVVWSAEKRAANWPKVMKEAANRDFAAGLPETLAPARLSHPTLPPSGKPFDLFYYLAKGEGGCR